MTVRERLLPELVTYLKGSGADRFNQIIDASLTEMPSIWRDMFKVGTMPAFSGETIDTRFDLGIIPPTAGTAMFSRSVPSISGANGGTPYDRCQYDPITVTPAFSIMTSFALKLSMRSPQICVQDFSHARDAINRLEAYSRAQGKMLTALRELFNREMYMKLASEAGHLFFATEDFAASFNNKALAVPYDPAVVNPTNDMPIMSVPTAVVNSISTLNWTFVQECWQWLSYMAPNAAMAFESGTPIFQLIIHSPDFSRMIERDNLLKGAFLFDQPNFFIEGFNMPLKIFRNITMINDMAAPRWVSKGVDPSNSANTILERVPVWVAGLPALEGSHPIVSSEYLNAEFRLALFLLKDSMELLYPPHVTSLGGSAKFASPIGFDGTFTFINIPDSQKDPLGEFGYYFARLEHVVRPLYNSTKILGFIYRACNAIVITTCDEDGNYPTSSSPTIQIG